MGRWEQREQKKIYISLKLNCQRANFTNKRKTSALKEICENTKQNKSQIEVSLDNWIFYI